MKIEEFDYELPGERIAQWPLAERDASRMLVLHRQSGAWEDRQFREFPGLLRGDELIVLNNARVIPARLFGVRKGLNAQPVGKRNPARHGHLRSSVEVLLLKGLGPREWEVMVRPGRKIPVGETIVFDEGKLEAEVIGRGEFGIRRIRFTSDTDVPRAIERIGHIPLPPYIDREDQPLDRERYQTIFARGGSAVSAPTAGLHFTAAILARLRERKIEVAEITLDVGLGTFEPIRTERLEEHRIHREAYEIPASTAERIRRALHQKRPILAVGTTVVRALEDASEKSLKPGRGEPSQDELPRVPSGRAEAEIFLYPGKPFRVVTQMLTNFHLPRSSLLALVAAFAGRDHVLRAYRHAVEGGYRFYSYGDCMWIR